jgi:hypothetical protein
MQLQCHQWAFWRTGCFSFLVSAYNATTMSQSLRLGQWEPVDPPCTHPNAGDTNLILYWFLIHFGQGTVVMFSDVGISVCAFW